MALKMSTKNVSPEAAGGVEKTEKTSEEVTDKDPRVNDHGVYVKGVHGIEVPLSKSLWSKVLLSVIQGKDGLWRAGFDTACQRADYFGSSSPISVEDPGYAIRNEALIAVLRIVLSKWKEVKQDNRTKKVIDRIDEYMEMLSEEIADEEIDEAEENGEAENLESSYEEQVDALKNYQSQEPCESPEEHHEVQVVNAERELIEAALEKNRIEEILKRARERTKEATKRLTDLMKNGPEELPLFDSQEQEKGDNTPAEVSDDDQSWRSVTTEELGLSAGICSILRDNPEKTIATLGDLADWTKEFDLCAIPRIAEAKANKIDEATEAYWKKRKGKGK